MKAAVLYYTRSGNTQKMAQAIAEGMQSVDGVEAKIFPIDDYDKDYVEESSCVVLGTPTYMASMAAEVKVWLDGPKPNLAGKLGGAFATEDYLHGGADLAVRTILDHLMVFGMLLYSGGGSCGAPVIHLGPVALSRDLEGSRATFTTYGKRMAEKASQLFG